MEWQLYAADAAIALGSRQEFVEHLRASCAAGSDYCAAEIVFGELVANVARHAPGPVVMAMTCDADGRVTLHVSDTGPAFALRPRLPIDPYAESGRGLYVVSRLCAEVTHRRTAVGNEVSALLPVMALRREALIVAQLREG